MSWIRECMGRPQGSGTDRCKTDPQEVGHGIFLCIPCQDLILADLQVLVRRRAQAERDLAELARRAAGPNRPKEPKPIPFKGEVSGGRFEENRGSH